MRIELKCPCGASAVFDDTRGTYINGGGHPDKDGRIYTVQLEADRWLDRHQNHHALGEGEK